MLNTSFPLSLWTQLLLLLVSHLYTKDSPAVSAYIATKTIARGAGSLIRRFPASFQERLPSYSNSLRMSSNTQRSHLITDLTRAAGTNGISGLKSPQFVFVGGKGGVGKTTTSSAIALACSDSKLKTLVVSTDPAHSLGDALDVDLSSGNLVRIPTEMNLWALEIDVQDAMQEFRDIVQQLDSENMARDLGIPKDIIESIGLEDLADIFSNPPPGIDEIVALSKIFQYAAVKGDGSLAFDRIIVDTAPTGHTLRLLQLPLFLNSLTGKLIKFRAKITGALDSFKRMFGGGGDAAASPGSKMLSVLGKLDALQESAQRVQSTLKDQSKTQFVVVTIPTQLAVLESQRLVKSLLAEGIRVSSVVCNQLLDVGADEKYVARRASGQRNTISGLKNYIKEQGVEVTEVPYVDTEITGLYGLRFFHGLAHKPVARSATNPVDSRKLSIFGGKGGVGKTTSAASWGVRLSDSGFKTLVVSTDPAHSLGDAFSEGLSGIPKKLDLPSAEGGQIWAMEIDPKSALTEFAELVQGALQNNDQQQQSGGSGGGMLDALGLSGMKTDFADMLFDVKNPPPGTDEVVALAKVINYLDNGFTTASGSTVKFDRVVLDTAPTGHTLRMLQLPAFLQKLIKKVISISDKVDGLGSFGAMMGMAPNQPSAAAADSSEKKMSKARLAQFSKSMERLEKLLHSPAECEFTAVTIPTELATAETKRLLEQLHKENILVRRIVMNQVIQSGGQDSVTDTDKTNAYLNRLRAGQEAAVRDLDALSSSTGCALVKVPYFDMEVRTVYGLRVVSSAMLKQEASPVINAAAAGVTNQ